MSRDRRRVQAFQPQINGAHSGSGMQLESRVVLSHATHSGPLYALTANIPGQPLPALNINHKISHSDRIPQGPRPYVQTFVATGGKTAVLVDVDGELYAVHVVGHGTVRAKAAPQGRVDLFIYGSDPQTNVSIDPEGAAVGQHSAHQFPTGTTLQDSVLHIRNITITSGNVGQIVGYRTADISGAVVVNSQSNPGPSVNRLAFNSLSPGASINVAGTLFTLDGYNKVTLDGGTGIVVSQDLDAMTVGSTLSLVNGAAIRVGRDLGAVYQAGKGSGPAGIGLTVNGDLIVSNGGTIEVGRYIGGPTFTFQNVIRGSAYGFSTLPAYVQANTVVYGQTT